MKISDIMTHKPAGKFSESSLLSCMDSGRDVIGLNQADISRLSPMIRVHDDTGRTVGSVDREIVQYLHKTCDGWVMGQIMDRVQECVIAVDHTGRIFYVNEAYTRILGVAKHNVLGRKLQKVEPGAALLEVLKTGQSILEKAVHIKSINHDVMVNIYPIKRDDGRLAAAVSVFRDVTETKKLSRALYRAQGLAEYFRTQLEEQDQIRSSIIGRHPSFLKIVSQSMMVAKTDAPVLITGENGVGKEVIAKAIHQNSGRSNHPLISVNCAAIPEGLLESELFGFEEGSFTGAKKGGKLGKFELAEGGTIFLDEIGDMSPVMQSKLLRVLQEKEIEKIGRTQNVPVNVRVLAATNRELEKLVKAGQFRSDLYYRLNVVTLTIPPLRERGEDIGLLAQHFLLQQNSKYNRELTLSPEVLRFFYRYDWPGNVRELQNCIEYAVIMCAEQDILPDHLPAHMNRDNTGENAEPEAKKWLDMASLRENQQSREKELIREALAACKNNKSEAMKMIGMSRRSFYQKLKKYGYM